MICVGIDPGLSGAITVFDVEAGSLDIIDMPIVSVVRGGKLKNEVSAALLADIFRKKVFHAGKTRVFCERVNAMKGQGVSSVFSFGRSAGVVDGVIAAFAFPYTLITPQTWQKATGTRDGKDGSRARASELFPAYASMFARKKDDGRADSALIAFWGAQQ